MRPQRPKRLDQVVRETVGTHEVTLDVARAVAICRVVNANVTARLVVGLNMCGLRGDDVVRLKRLKPPWINSTAAKTPPRRALASAPH